MLLKKSIPTAINKGENLPGRLTAPPDELLPPLLCDDPDDGE
jgi:hypothetical protein